MGDITKNPDFIPACKTVAKEWRRIGRAIRTQDMYASHVTEETKEKALQSMLDEADEIEKGRVKSFTIWQRVNQVLTGECVGFLGNGEKR